ncbi:MAG: DUF2384 domain-containing protein [Chlorobium sp.]|nr:MAG: DUF2384 domain-containing protein [Chlorobium sp.]
MLASTAAQPYQASKPAVLSKAVLRAADVLGIANITLAKILGLSPSTISRISAGVYLLTEGKKEWEFAVLLVRLFRSLDSIVGGNEAAAVKWLKSENKAFSGKQPVELITTAEGLVRVVTYLDAIRGIV